MAIKPLTLTLGSLGGTILLGLAENIKFQEPAKDFIESTSHHLMIDFQVLMVGGFLLWIVGESVEHHLMPMIRQGLGKMEGILNVGFQEMQNVLTKGFKGIEDVLSARVGAIPDVISKALEKALKDIERRYMTTPEVSELVQAGKIDEAVEKVAQNPKEETLKRREEISVLLHSIEQKDLDRAAEILDLYPDAREGKFYVTLAFRYWSIGALPQAIDVTERGLAIVLQQHAPPEDLAMFYNSLAYYYADGELTVKEFTAREYVARAKQARPNDTQPIDTEGYILITFGTTPEEIHKGVALCHQASANGTPFDIFAKHIERAKLRLADLKTAIASQGQESLTQGQESRSQDQAKQAHGD